MAPIETTHDDYSLLHIERISLYVPLPPASLNSPLPAICASVFSPLLLTYYPAVKGVVLAYEDVQLSDEPPRASTSTSTSTQQAKSSSSRKSRHHHAAAAHQDATASEDSDDNLLLLQQIDEYASPFLWATASLLVFRPAPHAWIPCVLTHASASHVTLAHLNTFPISILHASLPASWTWHQEAANRNKKGWDGRISDEGGWWVDGDGEKVHVGREVRCRIRDWDARGGAKGKGFLRVEASLLGEGEEREQMRGAVEMGAARKGKSAMRSGAGAERRNAQGVVELD
ncbi:hypothetical protein BU26DRAFT_598798 [Trematosphaeria pertusa]|uniref:DNA-directed RNA polymerase subunit n=1 Tax=Trematosphaeria pertusa TaxID=390896 RepID=A0A6A6J044_9PLEO|nr:uncharacterized protein BU26DRAFT_598798 [Trematosphaeria pertusa]KAF2255996.1 hypothetical protein BU26DRAFT_598798 [Trematosphaeria pertusa]